MKGSAIQIKICGLTNLDDAKAALDCDADFIGFVLYRKSPRGIRAARLHTILDKVDAAGKAVGVFVNEKRSVVEKLASDCNLYAVQIHGDEDSSEFMDMPVRVWRAVKVSGKSFSPDPDSWRAERYVIDASAPGTYGGSGVIADWRTARRLAKKYPAMLAGGLTPGNVAQAIRIVHPLGVDVATGVETSPGRKDHDKIPAFIREARKAESASV